MTLLGIDVSEFQGSPDWSRVAASGVQFAFARASYHLRADRSYGFNRSGIPAAGLLPGAYHFLTPSGDAAAQADAFCAVADPRALHALDVETVAGSLGFGRQVTAADVSAFVAQYRTRYPAKVLAVYTGRDMWQQLVGATLSGPAVGPLWVAGAVPNAYVSGSGSLSSLWGRVQASQRGGVPFGGWLAAALQQFTDSAVLPGISGGVDGDVFFGSRSDFAAISGETMDPSALWKWQISYGPEQTTPLDELREVTLANRALTAKVATMSADIAAIRAAVAPAKK